MKRIILLRWLARSGCVLLREGGNHTLYVNPPLRRVSAIPRHTDIHPFLAQKICTDLGIDPPRKK